MWSQLKNRTISLCCALKSALRFMVEPYLAIWLCHPSGGVLRWPRICVEIGNTQPNYNELRWTQASSCDGTASHFRHFRQSHRSRPSRVGPQGDQIKGHDFQARNRARSRQDAWSEINQTQVSSSMIPIRVKALADFDHQMERWPWPSRNIIQGYIYTALTTRNSMAIEMRVLSGASTKRQAEKINRKQYIIQNSLTLIMNVLTSSL